MNKSSTKNGIKSFMIISTIFATIIIIVAILTTNLLTF